MFTHAHTHEHEYTPVPGKLRETLVLRTKVRLGPPHPRTSPVCIWPHALLPQPSLTSPTPALSPSLPTRPQLLAWTDLMPRCSVLIYLFCCTNVPQRPGRCQAWSQGAVTWTRMSQGICHWKLRARSLIPFQALIVSQSFSDVCSNLDVCPEK